MSDIMTCIPFDKLVKWVLDEYKSNKTIFGVHKKYKANNVNVQTIFKRKLETPIGPAAGPNSQLAQNIVAAYYSGARFFELKTVQEMDGKELAACVNKPCILAEDECYNCEWSTELYVYQAYEEYVKAWFLLHIISKEYDIGSSDGFQFNISVGYNLNDIKKEKTNTFINDMIEAKDNKVFKDCKEYLLNNIDKFKNITEEYIKNIPSNICNSLTISTLHGCPPEEIEAIANYCLDEKNLNTFIKCNPTLLGYDFARKTMNNMGYDYLEFGEFHFKDDLQWDDAVAMFKRLMEKSKSKNLEFGLKITNTFPVDVKENQLPSEEMYMSGKSLYPLSISLAAKLSREFDGKLRIAYSGGSDYFNIKDIVNCGIWPVTFATTILKPGGYNRIYQMADLLSKNSFDKWTGIDVEKLNKLAEAAVKNRHNIQSIKEKKAEKLNKKVPLIDCFISPCKEACPIHQDIPKYITQAGNNNYKEALMTILEKNPLPFITGNLCAHHCMYKCTRNFYEESIKIRDVKLEAARKAYDEVINEIKVVGNVNKNVAIVGGGPAGISAAYYLLKEGCSVTIFEREAMLGGTVKNVIPYFRISSEEILKDIEIIKKLGAIIKTNTNITSIKELENSFDAVILAIGAEKQGMINIENIKPMNAIEFLKKFNQTSGNVQLGKKVVVIGGGNTAMDVARAAKRNKGVEKVSVVYRRIKRYMPADEEEIKEAMNENIEFLNLLSPKKYKDNKLICDVMELSSERDSSFRKKVKVKGEEKSIDADTIIVAVGEKINVDIFKNNGIDTIDDKKANVSPITNKVENRNVYVVGDGNNGAATIVKAMADAKKAVDSIIGYNVDDKDLICATEEEIYSKKGILIESNEMIKESDRCLNCNYICENCVDVCPNRANVSIKVKELDKNQIIHVDYMCNECGNCKVFCPYDSSPYLDKFTLFANEEDMKNSKNSGFCVLDKVSKKCKIRINNQEIVCNIDSFNAIDKDILNLINAVIESYDWLLI